MHSRPDKREAAGSQCGKPEGRQPPSARGDETMPVAESVGALAKPSWLWRGVLCLAVVCAVIGATITIAPELFLPARHAVATRTQP